MSEITKQEDSLDLIAIAEKDVIEKAKAWTQGILALYAQSLRILSKHEEELLAAVTLLEARSAMNNTAHLDPAASFTVG